MMPWSPAPSSWLSAAGIDARGDIGRLGVEQNLDLAVLPVEAVLLVADVVDGVAGQIASTRPSRLRPTHFAGDDDAIGRCQRLAGGTNAPGIETFLGAFPIERVDDFVRDAIADLVRMTFGNGLAREQK